MYAIRLSYDNQVRRNEVTAWAAGRLERALAERNM